MLADTRRRDIADIACPRDKFILHQFLWRHYGNILRRNDQHPVDNRRIDAQLRKVGQQLLAIGFAQIGLFVRSGRLASDNRRIENFFRPFTMR